jgi:hypothetical protein
VTDTFVTITSGQGGSDIPDGVYPVILTEIKGDPAEPDRPKVVTAQHGPKAGQDIELWDWVFAVDAPGNQYDALPLESSTSTASGPKSKMYAYITALNGGVAPTIGTAFGKRDLIGRRALATCRKDENGWVRIENLGAIPVGMMAAPAPAPAVAPAAPAAAPADNGFVGQPVVAAPTAAADLPF